MFVELYKLPSRMVLDKSLYSQKYHLKIKNITNITNMKVIPWFNLDASSEVRILGLVFKDTLESFVLKKDYLSIPLVDRLKIIDVFLQELDRGTNKGYLTSCDLSLFPVISSVLPSFIQGDSDLEYLNGEKSMESYK